MKTKKFFVIAVGLAILISLAGCSPQDTGLNNDRLSTQTRVNNNWSRDDRNGMNNTNLDTGLNDNNLNNGMVRNNMNTNNNRMTTSLGNLNTSANDLARKIGALPEVDKASVVLTDDTCLVGVDLEGTANTTNISTALRNKIEKMVEDSTNINKNDISITADPDLITRIRSISTNMSNSTVGNDLNDFGDDIQQLIRDIIPGRGVE